MKPPSIEIPVRVVIEYQEHSSPPTALIPERTYWLSCNYLGCDERCTVPSKYGVRTPEGYIRFCSKSCFLLFVRDRWMRGASAS